jgi:hypothetical protein
LPTHCSPHSKWIFPRNDYTCEQKDLSAALSISHGFLKNQKPFNANDADETNNANFYLFREIRRLAPFALRSRLGTSNLSSFLEKTIVYQSALTGFLAGLGLLLK